MPLYNMVRSLRSRSNSERQGIPMKKLVLIFFVIAIRASTSQADETVPIRYNGLSHPDCLIGNSAIINALKQHNLTMIRNHGALVGYRKAGDPAIYFDISIFCRAGLKPEPDPDVDFEVECVAVLKTVGQGLVLAHLYVGPKECDDYINTNDMATTLEFTKP